MLVIPTPNPLSVNAELFYNPFIFRGRRRSSSERVDLYLTQTCPKDTRVSNLRLAPVQLVETMGSVTADFGIPTIDISPYLQDPTSEAAGRVIQDVRNACMAVGFFSLVGHKIPRNVQDNVFKAAKRLFNLPIEEKRALRHPMLKNRGYEIIGAQALQDDTLPDLKEVSQSQQQYQTVQDMARMPIP